MSKKKSEKWEKKRRALGLPGPSHAKTFANLLIRYGIKFHYGKEVLWGDVEPDFCIPQRKMMVFVGGLDPKDVLFLKESGITAITVEGPPSVEWFLAIARILNQAPQNLRPVYPQVHRRAFDQIERTFTRMYPTEDVMDRKDRRLAPPTMKQRILLRRLGYPNVTNISRVEASDMIAGAMKRLKEMAALDEGFARAMARDR